MKYLIPTLVLLMILAGCGGGSAGSGTPANSNPVLAGITMFPSSSPAIKVNGIVQLQANGVYHQPDGKYTYESISPIVWSSSNSSVATVENGTVTGKDIGSVTISASFQGQKGSALVVVGEIPSYKITAEPGGFRLSTSSDQTFHLIATYPDASVLDLSGWVAWSSSDPKVLSFYNDYQHGAGEALLLTTGTTTVTATLDSGEIQIFPITVVP
jgi:uncharacterized protein YjdB